MVVLLKNLKNKNLIFLKTLVNLFYFVFIYYMYNINKVNVLIVFIFVLMFIGYFIYEKKQQNKIENFTTDKGMDINDDIKEIFKNVVKINNYEKNITKDFQKVFEIFIERKFIFNDVVNDDNLKKNFTKLQNGNEKKSKLINRCINLCNKHKDKDFFKKMKTFFIAQKDLVDLYISYFNSQFNFKNNLNHNQNTKILEDKIDISNNIIQNHDNIDFQVDNLIGNSNKFNVNKKTKNMYELFLDTERIKNKQFKILIEDSGIFTFLNNLRIIEVNNDNIKIYKNLIDTKKNILVNVSKICSNQNSEIENYSITREDENTSPEEIKFLQTSNDNTNTLLSFCKKMKKLDKPSEGGLMFKRFNKEFKKKKQDQIEKLEKEIDNIMNSLTQEEIDNFNLYMARTHDQANKQIQAVKLAKDNLDNAKKLKVNLS